MYKIIRGTTPKHSFKSEHDFTQYKKILVTYSQGKDIVLEKYDDDITFSNDGFSCYLRLSQRETNLFAPYKDAYMQMRVLTEEGWAQASDIITFKVYNVLNDIIMSGASFSSRESGNDTDEFFTSSDETIPLTFSDTASAETAGDITYNKEETYASGTVGSKLQYFDMFTLKRIRSFFYEVAFNSIPLFEDTDTTVSGCSSYVQNGKLYRNLDWDYSSAISFKVQCNGFTGMAFLNRIEEDNLDEFLISQLPYHVSDGRNDDGIMVSTHVLFNDWNWHGDGEIPMYLIPYTILTQVHSIDALAGTIQPVLNNLKSTPTLESAEYLLQFLVTDGTTTYAILPNTSGRGYVIQDITSNPKLSNFRWVNKATVTRAELQRRPTGVERWNAMPTALSNLRFTKAYESPTRLSEFIGIRGTTKDSTDEELEAIYQIAHDKYSQRVRDSKTWQTMHSIVYSSNGIEELYVQEDFNVNYSGNSTNGGRTAAEIIYDPDAEYVEGTVGYVLNELSQQIAQLNNLLFSYING